MVRRDLRKTYYVYIHGPGVLWHKNDESDDERDDEGDDEERELHRNQSFKKIKYHYC